MASIALVHGPLRCLAWANGILWLRLLNVASLSIPSLISRWATLGQTIFLDGWLQYALTSKLGLRGANQSERAITLRQSVYDLLLRHSLDNQEREVIA